jgi:hypothetical protein
MTRANINLQSAVISKGPSLSFLGNYKNISFDNLKERHDNFSFAKAIELKN